MNLQILPLAITMMAGPQIMSAIVFVTHDRAVPVSVAFVAGVAVAVAIGTACAAGIASLFGANVDLGESGDRGAAGTIIQVGLVLLLIAGAIKNWLGRETAEPPKWLGKLMTAGPKDAFRTGLLVILIMPSDVVIMLTVGFNLEQSDSGLTAALPFLGATTLIAALPLIAYVLFHRRARRAMPKVRDWMNANSWLVNIIVCCIFIALIL